MGQSTSIESNIWKIAVSDVLFRVDLINAVYILYFQFLRFPFSDIGLFEAVTSVVIIVTELPTGVLADYVGRKWTVFVANAWMLCFALLLGFSSGGGFVTILAGVLSGLEFSFKSGAQTAFLYDTLKALKREEEFLRVVEAVIFAVMAYSRNSFFLVFLLIVFTTNRQFGWLLEEYYKNRHIPSARRARILSAASLLYNSVFGGFFIIWLFGFSVDVIGGSKTLVVCSVSVLVLGLSLLQVRYNWVTRVTPG